MRDCKRALCRFPGIGVLQTARISPRIRTANPRPAYTVGARDGHDGQEFNSHAANGGYWRHDLGDDVVYAGFHRHACRVYSLHKWTQHLAVLDEQDNGRVFAMIGLLGILTQGVLIGPLTRRFGTRRLIPLSIMLTGVGLFMIPYTQASLAWVQMLMVCSCIAIGNGVFQPSSSAYLTRLARKDGYDLGAVMGAQEFLAFARILVLGWLCRN